MRRNMMSGAATTLANTGLVIASYPVYLHYLGYESFGVWLALTTVLTLAQLGNLGITQSVTKYVAEVRGAGDERSIEAYAATGTLMVACLGIVIGLGIVVFRAPLVSAFGLSAGSAAAAAWLIPWVAALSAYVLVTQVATGVLSGLGYMDRANYIQTTGRVISVLVSAVALMLGSGLGALVAGAFASTIAVHAATLYAIRRVARVRFAAPSGLRRDAALRLVKLGSGVFGGSLVNMALHPLNRILVARYAGIGALPVFEIAFTGAMQVRALFDGALRALMPEFSRSCSLDPATAAARARTVANKAKQLIWYGSAPAFALAVAFASIALELWLGAQYSEGQSAAFRIMLAGSFLSLLGVPAYYLLLGSGRSDAIFASHLVQTGANWVFVAASILWSGTLSVPWAAVSVSIGFAASSAYLGHRGAAALREFDKRRARA